MILHRGSRQLATGRDLALVAPASHVTAGVLNGAHLGSFLAMFITVSRKNPSAKAACAPAQAAR
ncbi:MAG: hypothetical protein KKC14_07995 [Alphaproteobacteria bacterium]|nr:hypothetical protein [Alphaproteobacteria bacterium]